MDRQWTEKYGADSTFWPLDAQAVHFLWHDDFGDTTVLPGLPAPYDMQQEEALALAIKTLEETYGDTMGEGYFAGLKPSVCFHFNAPNKGDRTWFIQFVEVTPAENIYCASVSIDAKTGEIINVTAGRSHG
jgi:hypothetical protein